MAQGYLQQQLVQSGQFSAADLEEIAYCRGKHNKLGFAYQLIHVRLLNYFPKQSPFEIIEEILLFTGTLLGIGIGHIDGYKKYQQQLALRLHYMR